jgi:hypothetical protein
MATAGSWPQPASANVSKFSETIARSQASRNGQAGSGLPQIFISGKSDANPFDFIECDLIAGAAVKLGRSRRFVSGDRRFQDIR